MYGLRHLRNIKFYKYRKTIIFYQSTVKLKEGEKEQETSMAPRRSAVKVIANQISKVEHCLQWRKVTFLFCNWICKWRFILFYSTSDAYILSNLDHNAKKGLILTDLQLRLKYFRLISNVWWNWRNHELFILGNFVHALLTWLLAAKIIKQKKWKT